mmetsp:Transcript_13546/g.23057  ORF Transcript_13546/g.23057 Transcript_13546/m.23057 type:complete len:112 (-) Transcript_13546:213-548(-)
MMAASVVARKPFFPRAGFFIHNGRPLTLHDDKRTFIGGVCCLEEVDGRDDEAATLQQGFCIVAEDRRARLRGRVVVGDGKQTFRFFSGVSVAGEYSPRLMTVLELLWLLLL